MEIYRTNEFKTRRKTRQGLYKKIVHLLKGSWNDASKPKPGVESQGENLQDIFRPNGRSKIIDLPETEICSINEEQFHEDSPSFIVNCADEERNQKEEKYQKDEGDNDSITAPGQKSPDENRAGAIERISIIENRNQGREFEKSRFWIPFCLVVTLIIMAVIFIMTDRENWGTNST